MSLFILGFGCRLTCRRPLTFAAIQREVWGQTWGASGKSSAMGKLNPLQVRNLKEPGRYSDGDGLILEVRPGGSKSWIARLQTNGRRRDYGLGSLKDISLTEARDKARDYRKQLRAGLDPLDVKRRAREIPTFKTAARDYHGEWKKRRRNAKHEAQWLSTLEAYAFPRFGDLRVDQIGTGHVRDALAEIWLT